MHTYTQYTHTTLKDNNSDPITCLYTATKSLASNATTNGSVASSAKTVVTAN